MWHLPSLLRIANLVQYQSLLLRKIVQMWYLLHICCNLATLVNPFFRPVHVNHGICSKRRSSSVAQKQKATGIITLSAVSTKICWPLFCLLFKKYLLSIRNGAAHRCYSQNSNSDKRIPQFCLSFCHLKCQVCLENGKL